MLHPVGFFGKLRFFVQSTMWKRGLPVVVAVLAIGCTSSELTPNSDGGVDDDDDAGQTSDAGDAGRTPDAGTDASIDGDGGILPATVLFADNFDSYPQTNISGRCRYPGDADCATAAFPWEEGEFTPGWSYLWTGGGGGGTYPYVAELTSVGARGGSGMNVQMWDENEHDRGGGQWGHDFQFAKYWYPEQHTEIWLQMWVYWTSPTLVTSNQKMTHIFHYDRSLLQDSKSYFNTDKGTDGGTICNWRSESGKMEFRCSPRCSVPGNYKCASGVAFASPDGTSWSGQVPRFEMRTGASCMVPDDRSYEAVFADGKWHKFEVGLRMNSAPGAEDGELELWFDDCRLGLLTGIPFRDSSAESHVTGFNGVSVGGNAQPNNWGPDTTDTKTWQVDDVQVCSKRCP